MEPELTCAAPSVVLSSGVSCSNTRTCCSLSPSRTPVSRGVRLHVPAQALIVAIDPHGGAPFVAPHRTVESTALDCELGALHGRLNHKPERIRVVPKGAVACSHDGMVEDLDVVVVVLHERRVDAHQGRVLYRQRGAAASRAIATELHDTGTDVARGCVLDHHPLVTPVLAIVHPPEAAPLSGQSRLVEHAHGTSRPSRAYVCVAPDPGTRHDEHGEALILDVRVLGCSSQRTREPVERPAAIFVEHPAPPHPGIWGPSHNQPHILARHALRIRIRDQGRVRGCGAPMGIEPVQVQILVGHEHNYTDNTCVALYTWQYGSMGQLDGQHPEKSVCNASTMARHTKCALNLARNKYYTPYGNATVNKDVPFAKLQSGGVERGSSVASLPSNDAIIAWGREKLDM